jgi:DUF971 family protein
MKPIRIKKESGEIISIVWDDNHISNYGIEKLRNECPCAGCKGETILFTTYEPIRQQIDLPGKYELKSIIPIGNYAIQIVWADGHDTGIYSWEYLRSLDGHHDCNYDGNS